MFINRVRRLHLPSIRPYFERPTASFFNAVTTMLRDKQGALNDYPPAKAMGAVAHLDVGKW
jgi:hypothetical protein